jgi:hypothetical protein
MGDIKYPPLDDDLTYADLFTKEGHVWSIDQLTTYATDYQDCTHAAVLLTDLMLHEDWLPQLSGCGIYDHSLYHSYAVAGCRESILYKDKSASEPVLVWEDLDGVDTLYDAHKRVVYHDVQKRIESGQLQNIPRIRIEALWLIEYMMWVSVYFSRENHSLFYEDPLYKWISKQLDKVNISSNYLPLSLKSAMKKVKSNRDWMHFEEEFIIEALGLIDMPITNREHNDSLLWIDHVHKVVNSNYSDQDTRLKSQPQHKYKTNQFIANTLLHRIKSLLELATYYHTLFCKPVWKGHSVISSNICYPEYSLVDEWYLDKGTVLTDRSVLLEHISSVERYRSTYSTQFHNHNDMPIFRYVTSRHNLSQCYLRVSTHDDVRAIHYHNSLHLLYKNTR